MKLKDYNLEMFVKLYDNSVSIYKELLENIQIMRKRKCPPELKNKIQDQVTTQEILMNC